MEEPDALDDLTELATHESGASDPELRIWSLDDDVTSVIDDLDDDVTSVVDDLGDDLTSVVDDLGDDVTSVMDKIEDEVTAVVDERDDDDVTSVVAQSVAPGNVRPSRTEQTAGAAVAVATSRRDAPIRQNTSGSLRDRVPESVVPWAPPERPRSPEFQAPAPGRQGLSLGAKLVAFAVALVMALLILWAAWPSSESPENPDGDPGEVQQVDDAG